MRPLFANFRLLFGAALVLLGEVATGKEFTEEERNWWAVQPVRNPALPAVDRVEWVENPIDLFVLEKLEKHELDPAPPADSYELIRRVYFDLHGLPPTPKQVEDFLVEAGKDFDSAYTSLIEDLLTSPRYGERWAQHWLDVVRYAETDGYRSDDFRPSAYRYRDYVIRSFNDDKPYDQFLREQLAGDEIDPDNPEVIIGTGFLRHGVYEWNQRNARVHWELIINEMTNVTAETFLGLGFGCAQCHDHKFDPILQRDYYALQSFFATTWWPNDRKLATPEERVHYEAELKIWHGETSQLRAQLEELERETYDKKLAFTVSQFPPDIQEMYFKPVEEQTPYEKQMTELVQRQIVTQTSRINYANEFANEPEKLARYEALMVQLKELEKDKPEDLPKAFITTDISTNPVETYLGGPQGEELVDPAFLTLLGGQEPDIKPTAFSTGRRTALAEWIADPGNPLTTRVMANRIWHYHLGKGIVLTPNDFGTLGEDPSHPELLDWLSARFIAEGWKLKPLHRLIMQSATYRQTARIEPGKQATLVDPENRLLWRFPPQRLSAEQTRDAMLVASGEMKPESGGPSLDGDDPVRSIFVKKRRNRPERFLHRFDSPQAFDSAPERLQTTTPIQSLFLVNSEWPLQRAAAFAKQVLGEDLQLTREKIATAYKIAFNRPPSNREIDLAFEFMELQQQIIENDSHNPGLVSEVKNSPLAPVADNFSGVDPSIDLGDMALRLEQGSRYERLELPSRTFTRDSFSVETVVKLNRLHEDAAVNTILSQWNGDFQTGGWSIGITSTESKYDPGNFIVQLVGENGAGNMEYEVVVSGLRVPLNKPVYLAAVIIASNASEESGGGTVTFYLKDLSDPNSELQKANRRHSVASRIQSPHTKRIVGGRDAKRHLWNGEIARLAVSDQALDNSQLFIHGDSTIATREDWKFTGGSPEEALPPGSNWMLPSGLEKAQDPLIGATIDFCHALLSSNEFLYLH